jgi:hypothetical protein
MVLYPGLNSRGSFFVLLQSLVVILGLGCLADLLSLTDPYVLHFVNVSMIHPSEAPYRIPASCECREVVKSRQWDRQPAYPKLVIELTNGFDMPASASENPFRGAV